MRAGRIDKSIAGMRDGRGRDGYRVERPEFTQNGRGVTQIESTACPSAGKNAGTATVSTNWACVFRAPVENSASETGLVALCQPGHKNSAVLAAWWPVRGDVRLFAYGSGSCCAAD